MKNFQPNDLVWAKMKGYPHWPGKVANPDELSESLLTSLKYNKSKNSFIVYFPDSNSHSLIPENNVYNYEENRQKFCKEKKAKFIEALKMVEAEYEKIKGKDFEPLPVDFSQTTPSAAKKATRASTKTPKAQKVTISTPEPTPATPATPAAPESPVKPQTVTLEKVPSVETPKTVTNVAQQWSNTTRTKDYTRTPFESRKRIATPATTNEIKTIVAQESKKAKLEDSLDNTNSETDIPINGNIGVFGSGTIFEKIIHLLSESQPIKYMSKSRISSQAWAAHNKPEAKDILSNCRHLFFHFSNLEESNKFFFGQNSLLFYKGLNDSKIIINLSPFNTECSQQIDEEVTKTGAKYYECCMFLSHPDEVRNRKYPIIVCGEDFSNIRPAISKLSTQITYAGTEIGKACTILNGLSTINVGFSAILREVCSALLSQNIDLNLISEILQHSNLSSNSLNTWMTLIRKDSSGKAIPAVHSSFNNKIQVREHLLKFLETNSTNQMFLTGIISQLIKN